MNRGKALPHHYYRTLLPILPTFACTWYIWTLFPTSTWTWYIWMDSGFHKIRKSLLNKNKTPIHAWPGSILSIKKLFSPLLTGPFNFAFGTFNFVFIPCPSDMTWMWVRDRRRIFDVKTRQFTSNQFSLKYFTRLHNNLFLRVISKDEYFHVIP